MELITSVTVGSGGASSITLPATGTIPQTYTDLQLVCSLRNSGAGNQEFVKVNFNGSTSNYTLKTLQGDGNATSSQSYSQPWFGFATGSDASSNVFANTQIYITNYTSSNYKIISVDSVCENNITSNQMIMSANLWSDTSAITSIVLTMQNGANFIQGSTVDLYGISNANSIAKATGGVVSTDGAYWYHVFGSSGVFAPKETLSCDYLIVGGGGPGGVPGSGGGAGGYRTFTSQSLSATNYTVTIGAGGVPYAVGGNSVFNGATATGGGFGGNYLNDGQVGGSGGGGGGTSGATTQGGAGNTPSTSPSQGNSGGTGTGDLQSGGGGGGAGAVGGNASNGSTTAQGGVGAYTAISGGALTGAGDFKNGNYYFAGGGGGSRNTSSNYSSAGGWGGGAAGMWSAAGSTPALKGMPNTGGGGGAAGGNMSTPGAGGSGIVIIRYAI